MDTQTKDGEESGGRGVVVRKAPFSTTLSDGRPNARRTKRVQTDNGRSPVFRIWAGVRSGTFTGKGEKFFTPSFFREKKLGFSRIFDVRF